MHLNKLDRPPTPRDPGQRPGDPSGGGPPDSGSHRHWGWVVALAALFGLLLVNYAASQAALHSTSRFAIPYRPTFLAQVKADNVAEIDSQGSNIQADMRKPITYQQHTGTEISTFVPAFANLTQLSAALGSHDVTVNAKPVSSGPSAWVSVLAGFGPAILLVLVFAWFLRRNAAQGGSGGLMGFGQSRARRAEGRTLKVTFDDVAGIDEAKMELTEIVQFLRDPTRFTRLGGRMPRGVLLSGRPGTGKTLLARAVAGQAGAPFFQMSASEFVEMIVGVGAARVRDLFRKAQQEAPAIIFIDELDAIGRSRAAGANISGGHDEREQTLNQILTEMDGFDPKSGIVVIAATNRPEILDPALLRPGRFDRQVAVAPPDRHGREQILRVHTRALPVADDVDLPSLAAQTPGMVGADLANLANEAALGAARRDHDRVQMRDFTNALERIMLGAERRTLLSHEDRRRIAYHEGGHAIVGMLTDLADPVRKVTIIPHGQALGVTLSAPDADLFNYPRDYLLAKIQVALGGRVAEELVFGDITTGAESDIQQLTQIARQMVGRWGMSERIGPVAVLPADGQGPLLPGSSEVSPFTQREVDREVRRLVDEAHVHVTALLTDNRDRLESLADALLEHETLDEAGAYAAAGLPAPAHEPAPAGAVAQSRATAP